ncbi:MAG TPA: hypothetical protein VLZ83_12635 [Edaphocola sp.]|nr:hypothetical protein [Edaphocola sp.]
MKYFIGFIFLIGVLFSSCNKKGGDSPFFFEKIKGVYIKSETGWIVDSLGVPDSYGTDNSFTLKVLGNPVDDTLRFQASEPSAEELYYTLRLEVAGFDNMPYSLPSYIGTGVIPVENVHLSAGSVKWFGSGGSNNIESVKVYVGDLPRGFYKLYIEMKDGRKFWENVWIYRPE